MKEFSEEQYAEYKEIFNSFDKNGDGAISASELGKVMESLGLDITTHELQEMIQELDTTGTNTIDFNAFLSIMVRQTIDSDHEIQEAFKLFDKDRDGKITAEDVKEIMACCGEKFNDKEIEEIIHETDRDGDGQIDFDDFYRVMKTK